MIDTVEAAAAPTPIGSPAVLATATSASAPAARRRRHWWRPALAIGAAALALAELHGRLPAASSTWTVLRQAQPSWLTVAAALQIISMVAFSQQQRSLLAAFGVQIPAGVSLATTYARSAMSTAMPAGTAVSAGYAFRRFRLHGARHSVAAAVMLLSGLASVLGLAALYAGDLLSSASRMQRLAILAGGATLAWLAWRFAPRPASGGSGLHDMRASSLSRRVWRSVPHTVAMAALVPAHRWAAVIALAAVNWLADLACLGAAVHALGLSVPLRVMAAGYFAVQLARQIPLTPGGIGVIEAGLIVTLTAGGAPAVAATAAVLVYRLLSCWAVLPVGLVCWAGLRRTATAS
ncbi:lysylphosphatidylglycerol synthase transmembrane domain-containing protein [Krasilnikovia sp. MM14-A1259]|uniref:lysylphosphatidylglycerol synthase transmembrane domain-containing protein n=1 Tax=Krasilnikovia sp. MM14-A1259 TaxID=3373539 RepID=UPI00380AC344